jgi:hypothetical protein
MEHGQRAVALRCDARAGPHSIPAMCGRGTLALLLAHLAACATTAPAAQPAGEDADCRRQAVVCSYNPETRAAALEMLAAGGNAFDAFVARPEWR